MARALPGPLVSDVAGSIAGTSFRAGQGGLIISAKPGRRSTTSTHALTYRALVTYAVNGFRALSVADRAAWTAIGASLNLSGPQVYTRAWIHQAGDPSGSIAPSVPSLPAVSPVSGSYATYDLNLYLMALTRPLLPLEYCLLRTHTALPANRLQHSRAIHGYSRIDNAIVLSQADFHALLHLTSSELWSASTYPSTGNIWTVEGWWRQTSAFAATAFMFYSLTPHIYWYVNNVDSHLNVLLRTGVNVDTGYSWPAGAGWHYVVVISPGANVLEIYVDNVLISHLTNFITIPLSGTTYISSFAVNAWPGATQLVRISNVARTPTEIATGWNGGLGRMPNVDANTLSLWPMSNVVAGTSPDLGPNNKPLTITSAGFTRGILARLLYAAATTPYPTPRTVQTDIQPLRPTWMLAAPSKDFATW